MTPPSADAICGGCYLYEHRGVCPAARDAYGLHNSAEAERRVERFRIAITQDAQGTVGLRELVRLDAERQCVGTTLGAPQRLALLSPAASSIPHGSRKEKDHVAVPRTVR
jgi:hypothetical protein